MAPCSQSAAADADWILVGAEANGLLTQNTKGFPFIHGYSLKGCTEKTYKCKDTILKTHVKFSIKESLSIINYS